jgi:hypothetical protein
MGMVVRANTKGERDIGGPAGLRAQALHCAGATTTEAR